MGRFVAARADRSVVSAPPERHARLTSAAGLRRTPAIYIGRVCGLPGLVRSGLVARTPPPPPPSSIHANLVTTLPRALPRPATVRAPSSQKSTADNPSFYPRDAMLWCGVLASMNLCLRVSVCLSHADIVSKRPDVSSWVCLSTRFPRLVGPIPWGHSGPLCHALSLSSSSL